MTVFFIAGRRSLRQNFAPETCCKRVERLRPNLRLDRLVRPIAVVLLPRNGLQAPARGHHLEVLEISLLRRSPELAPLLRDRDFRLQASDQTGLSKESSRMILTSPET